MNQQACLYIKDVNQFKNIYSNNREQLLNFSNKFRSFVFISEDQFSNESDFITQLNENSILNLNEILTQFLTHDSESDQPIKNLIVVHEKTKHWVQDIDIFVSFPCQLENKLKKIGHHIYFYKNLEKLID